MKDAKTLKLAYRPVTAEALEQYLRLTRLELDGRPPLEALKEVGILPDDVTRIAAAVHTYCRPRLLRRHLAQAKPTNPERQQKQREKLALPIDDSDFVELYGDKSHAVFEAHEEALIALRTEQGRKGGLKG